MELKEYWRIIRKRLWMVLLIPIIAALVSGYYSYRILQPIYAADATILVARTSDTMPSTSTVNGLLQSQALDSAVLSQNSLPVTETELSSMVSAQISGQLIDIQAVAPTQPLAAQVANAVVQTFQQQAPSLIDASKTEIVNHALTYPNALPVSPKKHQNILLAFVFGLLVSIGLTFLLEYLDTRVKTEEDVLRYFNLPVLAAVEEYKLQG